MVLPLQTAPSHQPFHPDVSRTLPGCPIVLAGLVVNNRCGKNGVHGEFNLGFIPQASLNHSGVCCCDLIFG